MFGLSEEERLTRETNWLKSQLHKTIAERDNLRDLLREVEWGHKYNEGCPWCGSCLWCGGIREHGHESYCRFKKEVQ